MMRDIQTMMPERFVQRRHVIVATTQLNIKAPKAQIPAAKSRVMKYHGGASPCPPKPSSNANHFMTGS